MRRVTAGSHQSLSQNSDSLIIDRASIPMDQHSHCFAMMPSSSCLGPIPVSPSSGRGVWNGDTSVSVPVSFLGVAMNADDDASSISECDSMEDNELESLISSLADDRQEEEVFTPYPFDRQTREEIDNFHQLGLSFGEDWSLQLAEEVTCTEDMSLDPSDDDDEKDNAPITSVLFLDESEEVKAMRNRLWKQSLKTSMFKSTSLPCDNR